MPSSSTTPSSTNPSMTGVALKEFTVFPKLPIELRSKIWKLAVVPRLVTTTPLFKEAIPAIYHTSQEARAESKYQFYSDRYLEGPVINYDTDILFVNKWNKNPFSSYLIITTEIPYQLAVVKRLALVLGATNPVASTFTPELERMYMEEFGEEAVKNPWFLLEKTCPALEELILFVRPGLLGATIEDLYEVHEAKGSFLQGEMDQVVSTFQKTQVDGKLKNLKLTFMRNETWAQ